MDDSLVERLQKGAQDICGSPLEEAAPVALWLSEAADRIIELEHALAEARSKAIEECARVVEEYPEMVLQFWERPGGPPGNGFRQTTRSDIAKAIRAFSTQAIDIEGG